MFFPEAHLRWCKRFVQEKAGDDCEGCLKQICHSHDSQLHSLTLTSETSIAWLKPLLGSVFLAPHVSHLERMAAMKGFGGGSSLWSRHSLYMSLLTASPPAWMESKTESKRLHRRHTFASRETRDEATVGSVGGQSDWKPRKPNRWVSPVPN